MRSSRSPVKVSLLTTIALTVLLAACAAHAPSPAAAKPPPAATRWLCRPGAGVDPCATADLSATERGARDHGMIVPHARAANPKADCFYVYPTVDLELVPGVHHDLDDTSRVLATTLAQAGRFSSACALWVPLYRQITLGSWLQPREERERLLAIAFGDVERAFADYLAQAPPGRPVVLVGHSQGAEMVVRLVRRFFESAEMRARLLLAMPIGGEIEVPEGQTRGGTLAIPVCTRPRETGCVVAYRTHWAKGPVDPARWAPRPGHETVCVDPSALDVADASAPHPLAHAYFPVRGELGRFLRGVSDVETPFAVYSGTYEARCVRGERGYAYLAVEERARDHGPVDLGSKRFELGKLGLHVLDLQLAQGDLVDLVARRVAALP